MLFPAVLMVVADFALRAYDYANCVCKSPTEVRLEASPENNKGIQFVLEYYADGELGFSMRNETGKRLYYADDYRLNFCARTLRNSPYREPVWLRFIDYGDTMFTHVWLRIMLVPGIYVFERDFFLDADLTEFYTTLAFEFGDEDEIRWWYYRRAEDVLPRLNNQIRNFTAFYMAGRTSENIALASEVAVSRTAVEFSSVNLSTLRTSPRRNFYLLVYENGWEPVPLIFFRNWPRRGGSMWGGDVIEEHFNLEELFGTLANGRYMIMSLYNRVVSLELFNHTVEEMMLVEFVIDDNTPMNLDGISPTPADLSIYVDEITPTGLRLNIANNTSQIFMYNGSFILQKYVYGDWNAIYELDSCVRYQHSVGANSNY